MSGPATRSPHLLHADEDQLDRAAAALRRGTAFVIAVCPPDLEPAALARLREQAPGLTIPAPHVVDEAWAMMGALIEQVPRKDRVLSLRLGQDVMSALDGLNLHREKVLRGGPVILWLPDVDTLMKMRERAPDAFSFRTTMVVVAGDGGALPQPKREEPEDVTRARKRLKRAKTALERAMAGQLLAESLRVRGKLSESESEARKAYGQLPIDTTEESEGVRIRLCGTIASVAVRNGMVRQAIYWLDRAVSELDWLPLADRVRQEVYILTIFPGPTAGRSIARLRRAREIVESYGLGPEARGQLLRGIGLAADSRGDVLLARSCMSELRTLDRFISTVDRASGILDLAWIEMRAGNFLKAEALCREAAEVAVGAGGSTEAALICLSWCHLDRDEIEATIAVSESAERGHLTHWLTVRATVDMKKGDVGASFAALNEAARMAEEQRADGWVVDVLSHLGVLSEQAADAERLSQEERGRLDAEIGRAENVLLDPDGPVWCPIFALAFRADLCAFTRERLPQAIDFSRQALGRARSTCVELLPATGRNLADILVKAHLPDDALAAVADVEPYAAENGFLAERARLFSARLLAHVQLGAPPSTLDSHLAALREALAATDSPRITAETLRDLAKRLPPTCTHPDPAVLAEEALDLFVPMPMPAQEARCLEIMGDALLARGNPTEAKRRYLTARARLERYGLGLRLPLLSRKIDAIP